MIFELDDLDARFPPAELAEEDGLLAVGGDLTAQRLINAYHNGIFPWYSDDSPILWYSPHERFVLFPEKITISKSMRQTLRSGKFRVTSDTAFEEVISACAAKERKDQDGTWITTDMQEAYIRLHQMGIAHSVEVWQDDQLVGGLYGISSGKAFCGESMFSNVSNASKIALIWLCHTNLYALIDCQIYSEHLATLGAEMLRRNLFLPYVGI
ncbi:Leucyl/phenylalanyl-tRNA--protein transferase [Arcticibacter svalbardensis MN12-7]|uniref:Leucyl/phenylalanyl-tRNA--protein transferase n=1 Tax=Arcticibacter svalbardensis MN12-7 TaxID=1150600 RepID=R9GLH1_9SPHI|nr:Leucyl/phenylalanyl-tRNA--protein transferase [Arcticibacter svalbardensis MN12-7]